MERHKSLFALDEQSALVGDHQRKLNTERREQGHCWSVQDRETSDGGP